MKNISKIVLIGLTALLMTSCSKTPNTHYPLAHANSPEQKQQYLLNTAQQYVQDRNISAAEQIFSQIAIDQLTPQQQAEALITQAELSLLNSDPKRAIDALQKVISSNIYLPQSTQALIQERLTQAYFSSKEILNALTTSGNTYPLLTNDADKERYLMTVWQKLQAFNPKTLNKLLARADNGTERGWLYLTLITKHSTPINEILPKIQQWQADYSNHPARMLLNNLANRQLILPNLPNQVALLLPLSGALGQQGQAIRNGFFAAFYEEKSNDYAPKIEIFDTNQNDISQLYQQAIQGGAKIVIGPLVKNNIETLIINQQFPVPTLALNTIPTNNVIPNLYQFGLSPNDESQQVAIRIWNDRHQRILLIMPNNPWGQRIKASFMPKWTQLGGKVAGELDYQSHHKISHEIRELLNLDQSGHRALVMRWLLKKKPRYIPRRRQDFDAIFLIATPSMGRQILPLLRFYYANNVPIYSTSQIYRGHPNPRLDRDLDGVIFDDMPWLHATDSNLPEWVQTIQTNTKALWPRSFMKYPRLYALGTDAFGLIQEFNKFSLIPHFGVNSATGMLYLQPNGQIYRQLIWAKMKNGKPQLLSS
jgi:uncharacterized protein